MASFGGLSLNIERWLVPVARREYTEVTRPGVPGRAFRLTGYGAGRGQAVTRTLLTDDSLARTVLETYRDLAGQSISVIDDNGNTYTGVFVHGVREVERRYFSLDSGGRTGGLLLWCEWELQDVSV